MDECLAPPPLPRAHGDQDVRQAQGTQSESLRTGEGRECLTHRPPGWTDDKDVPHRTLSVEEFKWFEKGTERKDN